MVLASLLVTLPRATAGDGVDCARELVMAPLLYPVDLLKKGPGLQIKYGPHTLRLF
jgi:hypothetical protein